MKKITILAFVFILLTFITGCAGYKPIFGSTNLKFKITDYTLSGNKILGNKIYSRLYNLSETKIDDQSIKSVNIFINVSKNKEPTSKDLSGKILANKITLNSEIKITNSITNDKILEQTFITSVNYKIQDQYSDTVKLENQSIENLINKTYQDLLIKFSKNIASE